MPNLNYLTDFLAKVQNLVERAQLPCIPTRLPGKKFNILTKQQNNATKTVFLSTSMYGRVKCFTVKASEKDKFILLTPGPCVHTNNYISYLKGDGLIWKIIEAGKVVENVQKEDICFGNVIRPEDLPYFTAANLTTNLTKILNRRFNFIYTELSTIVFGRIASISCHYSRSSKKQKIRLIPDSCFLNGSQIMYFEMEVDIINQTSDERWTAYSTIPISQLGWGKLILK